MRQLPDAVVDQAIDWMVLERSQRMSQAQRLRMQAWLEQDACHRRAWECLRGVLDGGGRLREGLARHPGIGQEARDLLLRPARRSALRALGVIVLGGGALALADRAAPLRDLTADLRTGTGQRRSFALSDGGSVLLNARSAADVAFDARRRLLVLREGELLATIAMAACPCVLEAGQGTLRTFGARLCLRREADAAVVGVLQGEVSVRPRSGGSVTLSAGRAARLGADTVQTLAAGAEALAAWSRGLLEVMDTPLGEVVEHLRPYRYGLLRVAPEAARLRVQGVFPLDDSDLALRVLVETLPIQVRRYGPLTLIETAR